MAALLLFSTGVIWVFATALFVISLVIKRNDIADVAWGTGILLVALVAYVKSLNGSLVILILFVLAALWGLRLTVRILLRNIKKKEDSRYAQWREQWGKWFYVRSYFQVYLLQGFLMIVVGYPFLHASYFGQGHQVGPLAMIGGILWCVGYFFEVVSDYQLDRFLANKNNHGKIMTSGLWKYSRHPNYFGEVTMWWGIWLMVLTMPYGYIAVMSPIMITFLILKVSGIPMLEKRFEGNEEFENYKERTNAFFPFKPKLKQHQNN